MLTLAKWKIINLINKVFMKGFRAVGWCYNAYELGRTGFCIRESGFEDWTETPKNPITAWREAFLYRYKTMDGKVL